MDAVKQITEEISRLTSNTDLDIIIGFTHECLIRLNGKKDAMANNYFAIGDVVEFLGRKNDGKLTGVIKSKNKRTAIVFVVFVEKSRICMREWNIHYRNLQRVRT